MKRITTIILYLILLSTLVLKTVYADEGNFSPMPVPTPKPQKYKKPVINNQKAWKTFKYNIIIKKVAKRYNLDPQLIYATIMTESEGNEYAFRYEPHIKDSSLCMGQILVSTARSLGFKGNPLEMYQPDVCIDLIGRYHRKILDRFGDLSPLQLAVAYNTGSPWGWPAPGHLSRFKTWYNETVKG